MTKIRNNRLNTCCGHDGIRLVDKYINTSFDIVYAVYENLDKLDSLKGLVNSSDEEIQKRVDEIINNIETSSKELKPLIEDIQKGTYDNGQRQLIVSLKDVKEGTNYKFDLVDHYRNEVYTYDLGSTNVITFSGELQEKLNKHYPNKGLVVLPKDCNGSGNEVIIIDKSTDRLTLSEVNIYNDKERYEFNWYKSTSSISNLINRMDEFNRLMEELDKLNEDENFNAIKDVYTNLDRLNEIYDSLDKLETLTDLANSLEESSKLLEVNNFVVVINSEEELERLNTAYFKSARLIVKEDNSLGFSDYIFVSNKWLKISTTKNNDQFLTISFVYRNGSAIGGEKEISFESEVNFINAVYLNGVRNIPSKLGKLNFDTNKFELLEPLVKGDELIFLFADTETTTLEFNEAKKIAKEALDLAEKNKEDISNKRDINDNVFDGHVSIKSDGEVRGRMSSDSDGLQLEQIQEDGTQQNFTFPRYGEGGEIALKGSQISQVTTASKLVELKPVNGDISFVKDRNAFYVFDAESTLNADYGTILTGGGTVGRWIALDKYNPRFTQFRGADRYLFGDRAVTVDGEVAPTVDLNLITNSSLNGVGYSSRVNKGVGVRRDLGRVSNLRIQGTKDEWGIIIRNNNPGQTPQPWYCDIENTIVSNTKGVLLSSFETNVRNLRVDGHKEATFPGDGKDLVRSEYGVVLPNPESVEGNLASGMDFSFSNIFVRGCKKAIDLGRATIGFDAHVVGADTGVRLRGAGTSYARPGQRSLFGVYSDYNYQYGIHFDGIRGSQVYSPHIFELGVHSKNESYNKFGIFYDKHSSNNLITGGTVSIVDLDNVTSVIGLDDSARDNTIMHISGDYKMSPANSVRMRKQTVMGGCGKWAKHNNIVRANRANGLLAPNTTSTIVVPLDYAYKDNLGANVIPFFYTFSAREQNSGRACIGQGVAVVSDDSFGVKSTTNILTGHSELDIKLVNADVKGNDLHLTFEVTTEGVNNTRISVEVKRSVDSLGEHF